MTRNESLVYWPNYKRHQPFTLFSAKWKSLIKFRNLTLHLRANLMQSSSNDQLTINPSHSCLPAPIQGSYPWTEPPNQTYCKLQKRTPWPRAAHEACRKYLHLHIRVIPQLPKHSPSLGKLQGSCKSTYNQPPTTERERFKVHTVWRTCAATLQSRYCACHSCSQ